MGGQTSQRVKTCEGLSSAVDWGEMYLGGGFSQIPSPPPHKDVTRHAGVEVLQVRTEQLFICAYALRQVLLKLFTSTVPA